MIDPYGNTLLSKRYIAGAGNELGYYAMNTDVRGSTTNVIRADGTSVTGFVYDEFGNQIKTGESDFLVDATYTGSIYDEETELQYMNARYYDPGVGRFISRDSYLGSSHEPWTQHLYGYTGGNPVNYTDPTGHISDEIYHRNINKNNDQIHYLAYKESLQYEKNNTEKLPGKIREATEIDYRLAGVFIALGTVGLPIIGADQSSDLFMHYMGGTGKRYQIDYLAIYDNDALYRKELDILITDVLNNAGDHIKQNPRITSFQVNNKHHTVRSLNAGGNIESLGTLGDHDITIYANVTYDNKRSVMTADMIVIATDLYNFNEGEFVSELGPVHFERAGIAKPFYTYGYFQQTYTVNMAK